MAVSPQQQRPGRDERRFALLGAARRVWAVASIHGEAERLRRLHRALATRWQRLDRIVYLGNLIGRGPDCRGTLDELVRFRRGVLAVAHALADDVVYLRGSQEEMWQKLLQLQFATDPSGVLRWMLAHGLDASLAAYGYRADQALQDARGGTLAVTRWTAGVRAAMQRHPGHFEIFSQLRRAALTADRSLLFVNAGLDPSRPLEAQKDAFWWGHSAFAELAQPFEGFRLAVRGFDARHPGLQRRPYSLTLDGGAGFGGPLLALCLSADGETLEVLEA